MKLGQILFGALMALGLIATVAAFVVFFWNTVT